MLAISVLLPTKFIPGSLGLKDMSEIKENTAKIIKIRAFIFYKRNTTMNNKKNWEQITRVT